MALGKSVSMHFPQRSKTPRGGLAVCRSKAILQIGARGMYGGHGALPVSLSTLKQVSAYTGMCSAEIERRLARSQGIVRGRSGEAVGGGLISVFPETTAYRPSCDSAAGSGWLRLACMLGRDMTRVSARRARKQKEE